MAMAPLWIVFVGGGIGAASRYGLDQILSSRSEAHHWPFSTFIINILGSFLAGIVAVYAARGVLSPELRIFCLTGVLGGFTTFSSFSVQTIEMLQSGFALRGIAYAILTLTLSVGSALLAVRLC